jgi:MFS family permease
VTRNPLLITLIGVAQRLPWLVFTLPAGVITDRVDRRRAMVLMDCGRGLVAALLAIAVALRADQLPAPDELRSVQGTELGLYALILGATLLLGFAEVLRDNSAQTILPAIVEPDQLERANGRLWAAESVGNTFLGPPLGSLLIAASFALPIAFDAASFLASATLMALVPGTFRAAPRGEQAGAGGWRAELGEGVRWLWHHPLLRPMAVILGLMNLAGMVSGPLLVLFVQEVLDEGATVFAVIGMGGAVGAVIGGAVASAVSKRLGSGTCLSLVLGGSALTVTAVGLARWWPLVLVLFALESLLAILWNVITVSLRQTIIPAHLLGRVNSVYRFFAWGMMPIGALAGGGVVLLVDAFASRNAALRSVWLVNGAIHVALLVFGRARLTTARIEAARAASTA